MKAKENVEISKIEEELASLWEEQKEKNKTKACLFNLIIYTHEPRRTHFFEEIIHSIIEKNPCRILFIQSDATMEKDTLNVTVSNESIGQGNVLIACDQITIKASKTQLTRIPFIILPHLIPDLPVYLLWGQDPTTESTILPKLEEFAKRLIFDAECTHNLQFFSQEMLAHRERSDIELMDINWALISSWRDAIAQTFHSKNKIEQLKNSQTIEITYNSEATAFIEHCEIQAIYLQGWLAGQLGWKIEKMQMEGDKRHIIYHDRAKVTLIPEKNQNRSPGSILNIEFVSKDNHFVRIHPQEKLPKAVVHISTLEKCDLPFTLPLPDIQRRHAFMHEIFYQPISEHYYTLLKTLAQIDWRTP